ncbi:tetratricopeptide repeat protein [Streptomyces sp. TRM 70361]|uniref:AfsR/SARP family transcriptional regulator n=1 Tax=Streptomyces sp. TRM 70361 TaxID=3116553 RepID=UPI002E7C1DED|nr:tetratricopeptide repeat protein [Streptomyces sp. TRM 70361]MEE1938944.1 tetratricopeptide repeat protein [Streptomyces sp. TRM 70361]
MGFRILLFGPVELQVGDRYGRLGSAKERLVLAVLAWEAGRPVEIDTLIHRVWDDIPPARARDNLYPKVSRIRGVLARLGGADAPPLTRHAQTYTLGIAPEAVDVRRYLGLVDSAGNSAEHGDQQEALHRLDEADRLWRGEPLAGTAGLWAEEVRGELARKRSAATVRRASALLALGRCADAVALLSPMAERLPLDESLTEMLALGLYGSGRTADADRLLRDMQRRLYRETGAGGGERLRRVQEGIAKRAPVAELLPHGPAASPPPRLAPPPEPSAAGQVRPPDNLPPDISWVGRRGEVDRLLAAATRAAGPAVRVVALEAIDGMAGVGKTSLAVHVAYQLRDRYPDGWIRLELRGHDPVQEPLTPQAALAELLRLFGLPGHGLPQTLGGLTARWRTLMADRRAVVILDDAAGPEQVRPLLPGASPSLVMITSRRRLTGLAGAHPISMDVLPQDEAVELFRRRVGPDRVPDDTETAEIVRLCGHLPLAIDIVASRFVSRTSWTAADLIERLACSGERLTEIRDANREIAGAFWFSYQALTVGQQAAFRRMGLYLGPDVGFDAAVALTGLRPGEADRVLEELTDCHLLTEPSPYRYRMHDLLREYARALAVTERESRWAERTVQRLLDHYLRTADTADRRMYPHRTRMVAGHGSPGPATTRRSEDVDPQGWFAAESANLLAALEYSRAHRPPCETALLVHVLAGFLETEGHWAIAEPLLREAVGHWRGMEDKEAEARALLDLGAVCTRTGAYETVVESAEHAIRLARETGDEEVEAEALHQLGLVSWHSGHYPKALSYQQRALALRTRRGDRLQQARALNALGIVLLHLGETEKSLERFREAVGGFRAVGDRRGLYRTLNNIGEVHRQQGNLELALRSYREALEISRTVGNSVDRATFQMNLAEVAQASGNTDEAHDLFQEALSTFRSVGDRRNETISHIGIGTALRARGCAEEAVARYETALALARGIGAAGEEIQALRELGLAEWKLGRVRQAAERLEAALELARRAHAAGEETGILRALTELRTRRNLDAGAKSEQQGSSSRESGRAVGGETA